MDSYYCGLKDNFTYFHMAFHNNGIFQDHMEDVHRRVSRINRKAG